jgi:hypothetical protein
MRRTIWRPIRFEPLEVNEGLRILVGFRVRRSRLRAGRLRVRQRRPRFGCCSGEDVIAVAWFCSSNGREEGGWMFMDDCSSSTLERIGLGGGTRASELGHSEP